MAEQLIGIAAGSLLTWNDVDAWDAFDLAITAPVPGLSLLWANGANIVACGEYSDGGYYRAFYHLDAGTWARIAVPGTNPYVYSIWGDSYSSIFAWSRDEGDSYKAKLLHWDGLSWSVIASTAGSGDGTAFEFTQMHGSSDTNVWATTGGDAVYEWDGVSLTDHAAALIALDAEIEYTGALVVYAVSATEVYIICYTNTGGHRGDLYVYNGSTWAFVRTIAAGLYPYSIEDIVSGDLILGAIYGAGGEAPAPTLQLYNVGGLLGADTKEYESAPPLENPVITGHVVSKTSGEGYHAYLGEILGTPAGGVLERDALGSWTDLPNSDYGWQALAIYETTTAALTIRVPIGALYIDNLREIIR